MHDKTIRPRPARMQHIAGIGVDRMGAIADASGRDFLRLENLDVDIPPDPEAIERTRRAADSAANRREPQSHLPEQIEQATALIEPS